MRSTSNSMRNVYPLSFKEEVGNCISHGTMGILLLLLMPYYIIRSYINGGLLYASGISVCFICLFSMFMTSCLYHSMPHDTEWKYVFRKLDHIMILLAIAGTYTPVCLNLLNNKTGYIILAIEWFLVIVGTLLKSISDKSHPVLSMFIYMGMGWLAIFILPTLLKHPAFLGFIIAGGLLYTMGAYFYAKKKPYCHFVWHIMINLASICQLIAVLYCI
ncbi:MAG: hemolysin III family protein [Bacillota bacterium]|nr:hemolysin III family protein [Bacillota bacterium]